MAITTHNTIESARAVTGPKLIRFDNNEGVFIVKTPPDYTEAVIVLSRYQIRKAITDAGLRSAVEAAVAAGSQDLQDMWNFKEQFHEDHPEVIAMATNLGLTSDQLHTIFVNGSNIT